MFCEVYLYIYLVFQQDSREKIKCNKTIRHEREVTIKCSLTDFKLLFNFCKIKYINGRVIILNYGF